MNGKTSHIHGLENLVMLKWQHAQINLKFQTTCYQNPTWLFFRNGQDDPKIHMNMQGTQKSQNNLEKEEQRRRTFISLFQNLHQIYRNQDSAALTEGQTYQRNIIESLE